MMKYNIYYIIYNILYFICILEYIIYIIYYIYIFFICPSELELTKKSTSTTVASVLDL